MSLMSEGFDAESYRAVESLTEEQLAMDDPQLSQNTVGSLLRVALAAERYEDALSLVHEYIDVDISYPSTLEGGILAAAMCRDLESLRTFHGLVRDRFPRGRACRGLAHLASALIAAIDGAPDVAVAEFQRGDDIWTEVVPPLTVAQSRAVFASTLGFEHPASVAIGNQARGFFDEHDLRIFLDGIVTRFPEESTAADLAV